MDRALDNIQPGAIEFDEAEDYFDKIIQNCNNVTKEQCANANYGKGRILNDNKEEYEEAMKYFDKAFEMNPSCCECLVQKSYSLWKLYRYKDADVCIDQALKMCPLYAHAWNNKGLFYLEGSDLPNPNPFVDSAKALEYFNRATDCDPNFGDAWYNKGLALQKLGRTDEAEAAFAKASECDYGVSEQKTGLEG